MTTKHKKRTPLIRRLSSIVAVFAIFIMSMPMAQAADVSGTMQFSIYCVKADGAGNGTFGPAAISVPSGNVTKSVTYSRSNSYWGINYINVATDLTEYEGPVGVYVSYYLQGNELTTYGFSSTNKIQQLTGQYTNHEGNTGTVSVDIDAFTPSGSYPVSRGHSVKAQFKGTPELPISALKIVSASNTASNGISYSEQTYNNRTLSLVVTSARIVSTEYSAELDAMENMADKIAEQNEMMQAMYGEIIALCNAILTKCGDLETAINLTNSYCSSMLDALGDIATTTNNIYDLLGTQFALLISTIQTESSNIQDAIANAESKLEAYFDNAGMGAVGTLPEETEDLENKTDGLIEDESAYESDASEQFADIVASFNGFSGGALNGVALATDLFTQIWNVLGEWKVVYTFPLIMGLVLLVIGRMSRFSGTMNSRNNGDKDVGGD